MAKHTSEINTESSSSSKSCSTALEISCAETKKSEVIDDKKSNALPARQHNSGSLDNKRQPVNNNTSTSLGSKTMLKSTEIAVLSKITEKSFNGGAKEKTPTAQESEWITVVKKSKSKKNISDFESKAKNHSGNDSISNKSIKERYVRDFSRNTTVPSANSLPKVENDTVDLPNKGASQSEVSKKIVKSFSNNKALESSKSFVEEGVNTRLETKLSSTPQTNAESRNQVVQVTTNKKAQSKRSRQNNFSNMKQNEPVAIESDNTLERKKIEKTHSRSKSDDLSNVSLGKMKYNESLSRVVKRTDIDHCTGSKGNEVIQEEGKGDSEKIANSTVTLSTEAYPKIQRSQEQKALYKEEKKKTKQINREKAALQKKNESRKDTKLSIISHKLTSEDEKNRKEFVMKTEEYPDLGSSLLRKSNKENLPLIPTMMTDIKKINGIVQRSQHDKKMNVASSCINVKTNGGKVTANTGGNTCKSEGNAVFSYSAAAAKRVSQPKQNTPPVKEAAALKQPEGSSLKKSPKSKLQNTTPRSKHVKTSDKVTLDLESLIKVSTFIRTQCIRMYPGCITTLSTLKKP